MIDIISGLIVSKQYVLLAMLPGIIICSVIVGAERTVALWLYLIVVLCGSVISARRILVYLYMTYSEKIQLLKLLDYHK